MIKIVIGLLLLSVQTASTSQKQSKITTALMRVPRRALTDEEIAHLCPQKGGKNCKELDCETDDDCSGRRQICCPYIEYGETVEGKCCVDPPTPKPGCLEVYEEIEDCPPCTTHDDCTDCSKCCYNREKGMCCQKLTNSRYMGFCPVNLETPDDCETCPSPNSDKCNYDGGRCCLAGDSLCCAQLLSGPCPEKPDKDPNCKKCMKDEDCTAVGTRCCPFACENCCIPFAVATDGCEETYDVPTDCQSCQEHSECRHEKYGGGEMACCVAGNANTKCCLYQSYYNWVNENYYCPLITTAPANCIKCKYDENDKCPKGTQCCPTRTNPCCLPFRKMTSGCVDLVIIPGDCEYCKSAKDCKDGKICCEVGPTACCVEPSGKPGCGLIVAPPEVCKKCSSDSDCVPEKETCCSAQAKEKSCCLPIKGKVNALCKPDYGYWNCRKCIFDSDCNGTLVCCPYNLQGCCIDPLDPYVTPFPAPQTTKRYLDTHDCPAMHPIRSSCNDCAETWSCRGNGEKCCWVLYGERNSAAPKLCCVKPEDATSTGAMSSRNVYLFVGCNTVLFLAMLTSG